MAKRIAAEKVRAGLRHVVVCPNVTGRTKERIAQSKRARTGSLAIVDCHKWCKLVSFGRLVCRCHGVCSLVLPLFCFVSFSSLPSFICFSICMRPDRHAQLPIIATVCVLFCFAFFLVCFSEDIAFSEYVVPHHYRFLFVWRVRRTFFPSGRCFSTL